MDSRSAAIGLMGLVMVAFIVMQTTKGIAKITGRRERIAMQSLPSSSERLRRACELLVARPDDADLRGDVMSLSDQGPRPELAALEPLFADPARSQDPSWIRLEARWASSKKDWARAAQRFQSIEMAPDDPDARRFREALLESGQAQAAWDRFYAKSSLSELWELIAGLARDGGAGLEPAIGLALLRCWDSSQPANDALRLVQALEKPQPALAARLLGGVLAPLRTPNLDRLRRSTAAAQGQELAHSLARAGEAIAARRSAYASLEGRRRGPWAEDWLLLSNDALLALPVPISTRSGMSEVALIDLK